MKKQIKKQEKNRVLGLFAGRHDLPTEVQGFIFEGPVDPSDMEELFRQMKQEQDEFNSKNAIPQIQIAYGYAEFDPETDRDIEDTRSRADDKMYQKKREIKADTNENKRTE